VPTAARFSILRLAPGTRPGDRYFADEIDFCAIDFSEPVEMAEGSLEERLPIPNGETEKRLRGVSRPWKRNARVNLASRFSARRCIREMPAIVSLGVSSSLPRRHRRHCATLRLSNSAASFYDARSAFSRRYSRRSRVPRGRFRKHLKFLSQPPRSRGFIIWPLDNPPSALPGAEGRGRGGRPCESIPLAPLCANLPSTRASRIWSLRDAEAATERGGGGGSGSGE